MKKVILLLSIFALCFSNITAQWVSTSGPAETNIESLNVNGTTIFAGSSGYGGVYKSTNTGSIWTKCNTGITKNYSVLSFCNIGTKTAVSTQYDILITSNNGDSWQNVAPANNQGDVRGLGFDGTYLYAAISGVGVARSDNEGTTWSIFTNGITDKTIWSFFVGTNKLFIGTNTGGVFSSTDKGATWQDANTGITNKNGLRSFAAAGTNLFAASYWGGIYKSTDNGLTWNSSNAGLTSISVRKIYSHGANIFASTDGGIFKSTDFGVSWSSSNNGITSVYSNNFIGIGSTLFVAVSGRGIYKSVNNGDQWVQSNAGITNSTIKTLLRKGSGLFAGAYYSGGVHNTNDGGFSWTSTYPSIRNVVQLISNNNDVYAATHGWGLHKTGDNGVTWTTLSTSLTNQNIFSVAVSGTRIFVGTDNSGVYSTIDNGATWTEVNNGLTNKNINMLTLVGNNLFASTAGGVFITENNGTSWTAAGLAGKNIITLKTNNNKIFAGTWGEGVYFSLDNGTTWTQIKNGMTSLNIFALAFDNNNNVYAAAASNVYSSKDGGANWVLKNEGLPYEVFSLEVVDNYLYAGTNQFGVWKRPLSELTTDVEDEVSIPAKFVLEQNYPNPFNPTTTISYSIPEPGYVTLKVFDVLGNEVATLVDGYKQPGNYNSKFSTQNSKLSSGVYLYTLSINQKTLTKKLVLVK